MVRSEQYKRTYLAWLLLATLLPMLVVKSIHCHNCVYISSEQGIQYVYQAHSVSHNTLYSFETVCPICHFIIPFYLKAESISFRGVISFVYCQHVIIQRQEIVKAVMYIRSLRAPPFSSI